MSTEKASLNPLFVNSISFVKNYEGISTDKALANILGISTGDFSNRKKRQTVPFEQLIKWAGERGVSLDDLFGITNSGFGHDKEDGDIPTGADWIALPETPPMPLGALERQALERALIVLRAPDVPGDLDKALAQNIHGFHTSVETYRSLTRAGEEKLPSREPSRSVGKRRTG